MKKEPRYVQTQQRIFSAHHMLMNAAFQHLETAQTTEVSRFNNALSALTLSALAIEALVNSIGDRLVPDWKDFESLNPTAKMRLLSERLSIEFNKDVEPWSTIQWLGKFRNRVAHPKPEEVHNVNAMTKEDVNSTILSVPHSKLERDITLANARRAVDGVYTAKNLICDKLTPEQSFGIVEDIWLCDTVVELSKM